MQWFRIEPTKYATQHSSPQVLMRAIPGQKTARSPNTGIFRSFRCQKCEKSVSYFGVAREMRVYIETLDL